MSKLVDYVLIKNFNNRLFDEDLREVFDFGIDGQHKIYRIVDAFEGYTIGAVEYALINKGLELRVGLNSTFRYRGLASNILKDVVKKIGKCFPNTKYLVCYISLDNKASLKMINRSGFCPSGDEIALEEGYQEYLLLNPSFQTEKLGNDEINFIEERDEETFFRLNIDEIGAHKLKFKRTIDGMELMIDYLPKTKDEVKSFMEKLVDLINALSPLYPFTEYFIYTVYFGHKKLTTDLLDEIYQCGFEISPSLSDENQTVLKYLNSDYRSSVKEALTRGIIKEKNN